MSAPSCLRALCTVAKISLSAALYERALSVVGVLVALLLGCSIVFQSLELGEDPLGFLVDFGMGLNLVFGSILAILLPAQRWFAEMQGKLSLPVLARSVGRVTYFVGQWLGTALVIGGFVLGLNVALGCLVLWQAPEGVVGSQAFVGLVGVSGLQLMRLWMVAAFVFLLGSFARGSLFVVSLSFIFVLSGQLISAGQAMADSSHSLVAFLLQTLLLLVPNLGAFAVDSSLVFESYWPSGYSGLMLYGTAYVAVYLALGAWAFSKRDL